MPGADVYGTAAAIGWQLGTSVVNAFKGNRTHGPRQVGGLSRSRQLFNQSTQHVLEMEQTLLSNAASQGNVVNDEVYRLLGYQPRYSNDAPDPAALKAASDQAYSDTVTAFTAWQAAKKSGKGVKAANARLTQARQQYAAKADAYRGALVNPRQIVGLDPIEADANGVRPGHDPNNPDDLMQVALDLGNQSLVRALKGEEPIDQTLVHSYEVGEQNLRERLRRQLGPDYETSTAGSQALNDFERSKGEAFQQFNRQTIQLYSTMTQQEATTLTNLLGTKIAQLYAPAEQTLKTANALGNSADDRTRYIQAQRDWIAAKAGLNINAYSARSSQQQADNQSRALQITANNYLAKQVGGGLVEGGASLERYLGEQRANQKVADDAYAVDNQTL